MRKAETKPPQVCLAYHQVAQRILLEIRLAQAEQIDDLVVRLRQNVVSSYKRCCMFNSSQLMSDALQRSLVHRCHAAAI